MAVSREKNWYSTILRVICFYYIFMIRKDNKKKKRYEFISFFFVRCWNPHQLLQKWLVLVGCCTSSRRLFVFFLPSLKKNFMEILYIFLVYCISSTDHVLVEGILHFCHPYWLYYLKNRRSAHYKYKKTQEPWTNGIFFFCWFL